MALVPASAKALGGLGAIPFVALAAARWLADPIDYASIDMALVAYGAVILSFLGGIHWGLAIAGSGTAQAPWRRLLLSVVPSLLGWVALLIPRAPALILLAVAFAAMVAIDTAAARAGRAPAWYPALRWPLTGIVVASLLAALFAPSLLPNPAP